MDYEYIKKEVKEISKSIFKDIIKIRQWIHQHPELSFQEKNTSKYICSILKKHNIRFKNGIAGYLSLIHI